MEGYQAKDHYPGAALALGRTDTYLKRLVSMSRNVIRRRVALVIAVIVAPAAVIFATALPANAAGNPHLCETNSNTPWCLGRGGSLDVNQFVVESSPGRDLTAISVGTRYGPCPNGGCPTYLLQFNADPKKCVGTDNSGTDVIIQPCNGGLGIIWAQQYLGTTSGNLAVYYYIDRYGSQRNNGTYLYLSGVNRGGANYYARPLGRSGVYYKFSWES
jgi:hypothetical protein